MREALTILLVYSFLKNHSAMFEGGGILVGKKVSKRGKSSQMREGRGWGGKEKGKGVLFMIFLHKVLCLDYNKIFI